MWLQQAAYLAGTRAYSLILGFGQCVQVPHEVFYKLVSCFGVITRSVRRPVGQETQRSVCILVGTLQAKQC